MVKWTPRTNSGPEYGSLAALLTLVVACGLLAPAAAAQSPSQVIKQVAYEQRINRLLPLQLTFRDEAGRAVALGDYFGRRPVVFALVYYQCPMLCTFVLNGLVKALKPLSFQPGREFEVVIVSFNPAETPELAAEKKAAYLRDYGRARTAEGWHFLTGDAEAITALTQAAGFRYIYDTNSGQYAHASGLIVVKPDGKLFRYFYGIDYAPRDLRLALIEASTGKLGTAVDQVLLYCFHYDPETGKYGVLINRVIRILGTGTALALAIFLIVMFRRERRSQPAAPTARAGTLELER